MKLLFPTDFSTVSENAYVYALKLAEKLGATVTVLHIYEVLEVHSWIEDSMDMSQLNEKITLAESEKYKEQTELLKRIARENSLEGIEVNFSLKENDEVVEGIVNEAEAMQADMIVMGTAGQHGLAEMFFSTISAKVMDHAKCPVYIVPQTATYRGIENVAVTLQYKSGELELIEKSLALAGHLKAHLHCLHVDVYDPEKIKLRKEEYEHAFANQSGISFHTHYELDTEKGILDYMKEHQMDVIVMRVHHQNLFRELFSHSLAKRIAYHSEIPLIAIPIPEKA
jgi:nucleotide-binding universal stress UspA family protein